MQEKRPLTTPVSKISPSDKHIPGSIRTTTTSMACTQPYICIHVVPPPPHPTPFEVYQTYKLTLALIAKISLRDFATMAVETVLWPLPQWSSHPA